MIALCSFGPTCRGADCSANTRRALGPVLHPRVLWATYSIISSPVVVDVRQSTINSSTTRTHKTLLKQNTYLVVQSTQTTSPTCHMPGWGIVIFVLAFLSCRASNHYRNARATSPAARFCTVLTVVLDSACRLSHNKRQHAFRTKHRCFAPGTDFLDQKHKRPNSPTTTFLPLRWTPCFASYE